MNDVMRVKVRKTLAVGFIILQLFLIFQVIKTYWAEKKVEYLQKEVFIKPELVLQPSLEELLKKLQRWSKRDPKVWELSARYSLNKMVNVPTNKERYFWAQEALRQSTQAVMCAPTVKRYQKLRDRCLEWEKIFASAG